MQELKNIIRLSKDGDPVLNSLDQSFRLPCTSPVTIKRKSIQFNSVQIPTKTMLDEDGGGDTIVDRKYSALSQTTRATNRATGTTTDSTRNTILSSRGFHDKLGKIKHHTDM